MQKTAIITGGSAGIGLNLALRAAAAGFDLFIGARNQATGALAISEIQQKYPKVKVTFAQLDLSDRNSIERFADSIAQPWDLLINNAGAKIQKPFKLTKQGHEWHIGVNHLGHFLLTSLLMPTARTTATVTTVTSIVARKGQANFLHTESHFNERQAYADSKFMNLAFGLKLAQQMDGTTKRSTVAHPGFAKANPYGNRFVRFGENLAAQSAWNGSAPIWEATQKANGNLVVPNVLELWGRPKQIMPIQISQDALDDIWHMSEELLGVKFNLQPSSDDA
jgi:NAD(P)-dependent dehydrogenase (short-subunit alcohol dehydrogenase family)